MFTVRRTLVVAPKGLASQWVSEMQTHFNEQFQLILGEDLSTLKRIQQGEHSGYWTSTTGIKKLESSSSNNPWQMFDQVIVSLDSVKPLDRRQGWNKERIDAFNRNRFEDLITAGWDLVIVDEAHRLGGSTDQVARYKLGRGLADAAPYFLLLSATPHQGKSDSFHRLLSLLDRDAFPNPESVSRVRVAPFVIRTEKRRATDPEGKPLFKPRRTIMSAVAWESRHELQKLLYDAVTEYVRVGYNQAIREKKRHIGFLMILMQRLVVSSTSAIRTTLERRLDCLIANSESAAVSLPDQPSTIDVDEWEELDGQEQLELIQQFHVATANEKLEVHTLLAAARRCEQAGPDAKAEALLEWIYTLQAEESEPDLKVLIFTEFIPTQEMLKAFLESRGISVVTLNGSMDMAERKRAQDAFREKLRVLVSTDAGGEGLNLQFCHVIINYDMPWNPMRLEQRIGRVDRIGQSKVVRAINLVLEDSVEFRVREVLEQKLAIIFEEFGIDKTGDVLDSAQAGELFEEVFTSAIKNSNTVNEVVSNTVEKIRNEIVHVRESSVIYDISEEPDFQTAEKLRTHPLPHWVERMTVSYLASHGGMAIRKRSWWDLTWPNGAEQRKCVFSVREAERISDVTLLNLENDFVRSLAQNLPQIVTGQPIPSVHLSVLPSTISGFWGLFEIRLQSSAQSKNVSLRIPSVRRGFVTVFLNEQGKLFLPTARHIWNTLLTAEMVVGQPLKDIDSTEAYVSLLASAEKSGQEVFDSLQRDHISAIVKETERGTVAFAARRKSIEKLGLPEVRQFRIARCEAEETEWRNELNAVGEIVPEIRALMLLQIVSESSGVSLPSTQKPGES